MSHPSSDPPGVDPQPRSRRRFGLLLALTVLISASSSGATILVLGDRVNSQAEVVANAEFRASSPVVVPVERKELSEAFTFRATLDTSTQKDLRLTPGIEGVVTSVPLKANDTVRAGSVVLEVQGRPVIALPGRFRAYRTIRDADTGPDVEQLQVALRSLGYRSADRKGTYGPGTQAALGRLYRSVGWEPPYHEETTAVDETEAVDATKAPARRRTIEARPAELFVVSGLPRRVDTVSVKVGQMVNGSEAVLSRYTASTRLKGDVPSGRADVAVEGTAVRVDVGGKAVTGRLVANTTATAESSEGASNGADAGSEDSGPAVTVLLDDRLSIDAGRSYRVTVEGKHTDGPVLAVPLTAVNERPDGTAFVSTQEKQGKLVDVEVTPGIQADGWVEITPRDAAALTAGTAVIVGGKDVGQ
ncbi:peptidoglycan-binding domain-containing protein [Micromonospora sp. NPDC005305]|uniref:peptidoglycan-binding domain-containing protein n=1 Tax=Micromonospora sp. NPDC005305 TaxID=3156875 RepID=UPI0033B1690E